MEVILLERIEKLGQMGDVVNVKPGYARNFLLPHKKAMRVTQANRAMFEEQRAQLEAENLKQRSEAERVAKDLDGMNVIIVRQASDGDQLYGSVTTRDIATAIVEAGITVDRRQVHLERPIKTVGMHPVRVVLHPEVAVEVIANVARSVEEAEMQARGERVNRDGDVVMIDEQEEAPELEAVFEDGAAPVVDDSGSDVEVSSDGVTEADTVATSDEPEENPTS